MCSRNRYLALGLYQCHSLTTYWVCMWLAEVESKTQASGQGQGHKKVPQPRPRTDLPGTDSLEAKDRNARGQGPRTQTQVLSKKKRSIPKFFRRSQKKKKSSRKIFRQSPEKNVFQKIFEALHKILTVQKIVMSSSRGQDSTSGG